MPCPSCGTLHGDRAEIDEYAEAIVSGRPNIQRPASLPRNLRVSFQRTGGLTITLPYRGVLSVIPTAFGLAALAAIAYGWKLALAADRWWAALLASVPLAFYAWVRLSVVFDGLLIELRDGGVLARQSRFWPKLETRLRTDEVRQLLTLPVGRTYCLVARKTDGTSVPLVRNVRTPSLALYLERQLEIALGIVDQPDPKELARHAPLPKPASRLRSVLIDAAFLGLIAAGPLLLIRTCGSALGELRVGDEPAELVFEVEKPGRVRFTSEIDLADNDWRYRADIPRSFRYSILILRGDTPFAELDCDPFDVFVWVSGSHHDYVDSFWGPMNRCAAELPEAGSYTLRAFRAWKPGMPRIRLEKSVIAPRSD